MIKRLSKAKFLFLVFSVLLTIPLIGVVVFSAKRHQPKNSTQDWRHTLPRVESKVKDLEIVNARIVGADSDQPVVAFEVLNKSSRAVMAVEIKCGNAGISTDGLGDEENPKVIIEPYGALKAEIPSEASPGVPIVITSATFQDGKEEGADSSIQFMRRLRARERAKHKAERGKQVARPNQ